MTFYSKFGGPLGEVYEASSHVNKCLFWQVIIIIIMDLQALTTG